MPERRNTNHEPVSWRTRRRIRRNLRRSGWVYGCRSGRHGNVGRCNCTEAAGVTTRCSPGSLVRIEADLG